MRLPGLVAALGLCACSLYADSIILTSLDTPLGEQSTLWISEKGTDSQLYWAGGINATIDDKYTRVLWCVQLFTGIGLHTNYNTTIDWADTPQLARAGWLVQNVAPTLTSQTQGAAFQLAIWDIIQDNGDGFAPGAGTVYQATKHTTDPNVLSQAVQYETISAGKSFPWIPVYNNVTINGQLVQNLIGPLTYDGGPLSEAPEPADAGLVVSGLVLIGIGSWRAKRRTHAS
jgi:hypothetical protein